MYDFFLALLSSSRIFFAIPPFFCFRTKIKKTKDLYSSSKGSSSISAASASADEEYYSNYNPTRTGGMMPKGKAIAPQAVKNVSPTASQTQVLFSPRSNPMNPFNPLDRQAIDSTCLFLLLSTL